VERIDESGRVACDRPAIAADLRAVIREGGISACIGLNLFRIPKNLSMNWVREDVLAQALAEIFTFRQSEDTTIVNQPRTEITAFERDDPAPPALTHEMVGRPSPACSRRGRVIRKLLPPLVAVPIFHPGETCPDGIN